MVPMTLDDCRADFERLMSMPRGATASEKQMRGRKFERILHTILEFENLVPRTNFRPEGEEIDGSFVLDYRTLLFEAKWHRDPLPASALYAFRGKIDGKLVGTVGIFISMSGYSENAADALRFGKSVNLLLFDGEELAACIRGRDTFSRALRAKLRAAAEEGLAYSPSQVGAMDAHGAERLLTSDDAIAGDASLVVVCEGRRDAAVLNALTRLLLTKLRLQGDVAFFPAMGKAPLGGLVNIARHLKPGTDILAVADSDGDEQGTRNLIAARVARPVITIVADPTLEDAWLGLNRTDLERMSLEAVQARAEQVDVDELLRRDVAFAQYAAELQQALGNTAA